jgi:hypothetical protein
MADGSEIQMEAGRGMAPRVGEMVRFDVDPEGITLLGE